jgi:spore germination protein YaaH
MKKCFFFFFFFFLFVIQVSSVEISTSSITSFDTNNIVHFDEVWAYLMQGEENFLDLSYKITDLCYFAASINNFGELVDVPERSKIKDFNGRVHVCLALVVEGSKAITHFSLDPKFKIRKKLIKDIVEIMKNFDGLQIDFEQVEEKDAENFYSFLETLKKKIGKKALSVAVFANTGAEKEVYNYSKASYDYKRISKIADRIIVMAYDQHYRFSNPGPVASLDWGRQVAKYSVEHIPVEKLVMGLPFYGRAWGHINPSRAYKHSSILKLIEDKKVKKVEIEDSIPFFMYKEPVDVTVYFENRNSIMQKARAYFNLGINKLAFWRLGQEDSEIWKEL